MTSIFEIDMKGLIPPMLVSAAKTGLQKTGNRVREVPFSSERKMMSVVVQEEKDLVVYTKGAPEILLSKCNKFIKNGSEASLGEGDKRTILEKNEKMAGKALRVLGFAYKKIGTLPADEDIATLEADLTFIGMQAMMDPPREGVKELIEKEPKAEST